MTSQTAIRLEEWRVRRVAFVVGTTTGGTGSHVLMLASGLARRGIRVFVYGPAQAGADLRLESAYGVRFSAVEFGNRPRPGDVSAALRLRRLLRGSGDRLDAVHAHGMRAGALTVLALAFIRRARPRVVVTVHNAPPVGGGVPRMVYLVLERIVAHGADLVLCVSSDLERRIAAVGARQVGRAVVPAPVRAVEPAPACGFDGPRLVLAVGRLAAQKGFSTLLTAAVSLQDMAPVPRVVIAGDGPLAGELRDQATRLGVGAEFLGRRDDVPGLLAAASVFVLPSLWEGQPLVLQEALLAAVPIVASRTGGISDLVGDDAALLVPPGDAGALAAAVREVLENPATAGRLRAAARARATRLPAEEDAVTAALAAYTPARS
jgi:glycosyltransferase involved in cell wall biosynthesis